MVFDMHAAGWSDSTVLPFVGSLGSYEVVPGAFSVLVCSSSTVAGFGIDGSSGVEYDSSTWGGWAR